MTGATLTLELHNRQQAWAAIKAQVFPFLAQWLQDGKRLVLTIGPRKRTKPQNSRYWSNGVLAQIAAQATVNGKLFSAEVWHEHMKRLHIGVIELPDGSVQGMSSKDLTTAQFCDFCTACESYAATTLGVTFYDLREHS